MDFPNLPFTPRTIHSGESGTIVVGMEGELVLLDSETFAIKSGPARPFPCEITHSVVLNDLFIATWVDFELQIGGMAAIPLAQPLSEGISRKEMRVLHAGEGGYRQIAGSNWSHTLDAEPLAMVAGEKTVCFANHRTGIYCIDGDSSEIWRRNSPQWNPATTIEGGEIVHSMHSARVNPDDQNASIIVWSASGEWTALDWQTGEELEGGLAPKIGVLDRVFAGEDGSWVLGWSDGSLTYLPTLKGVAEELSGGPLQDARLAGDTWYILGWRKDITLKGGEVTTSQTRKDLGSILFEHPRHGVLVADNRSKWTPFQS